MVTDATKKEETSNSEAKPSTTPASTSAGDKPQNGAKATTEEPATKSETPAASTEEWGLIID